MNLLHELMSSISNNNSDQLLRVEGKWLMGEQILTQSFNPW